jgi:hypothetical protein
MRNRLVSDKRPRQTNGYDSMSLVCCFENMQYYYESALIHAQSGLQLFEELRNLEPKTEIGLSSTEPISTAGFTPHGGLRCATSKDAFAAHAGWEQ